MVISVAIFDFDGTLVNTSYPYAQKRAQITLENLRQYGIVKRPAYEALVKFYASPTTSRLSTRGALTELITKFDIDALKDRAAFEEFYIKTKLDFKQAKEHLCRNNKLKAHPFVSEVIAQLQASGYRTPIASNAQRNSLHKAMEHFGLKHFFKKSIYCADDVQNTKPAADMLFKIMVDYKVSPKQCIMIGDTMADVEAAQAASIPVCIFIPKQDPNASEHIAYFKKKGAYVFQDYHQLQSLIFSISVNNARPSAPPPLRHP
tara:strand:- start:339 stop:1121 length:783 start_codon:yes stop_codon:yes gene_type:complete